MTGRGHRLTGLGAGLLGAALAQMIGLPWKFELAVGIIAAFSVQLPDSLEFVRYRNGKAVGALFTHRTFTHWGLLWFTVVGLGVFYAHHHSYQLLAIIALGAGVGAIMHLLGDAPNPMGVPWLWPTHRITIARRGLWRSGENESFLIVLFTLIGASAWLAAHHHQGSSWLVALEQAIRASV